jgi:hypothetical protein
MPTWTKIDKETDDSALSDGWGLDPWGSSPWGGLSGTIWTKVSKGTDSWTKITKLEEE